MTVNKNATYPHANEVSILGVGIYIHLDDTAVDGDVDFLLSRAGPTMEDKVPGGETSAMDIKNM